MLKKILLTVLFVVATVIAQSGDIKVNSFLVYGPLEITGPVLNKDKKTDIKAIFSDGDNIKPVIGLLSDRDKWDIRTPYFLENASKSKNSLYYVVFYLEVSSFATTEMKVTSRMPYRVYFGSEGKKTNLDAPDPDTSITKSVTIPLNLEAGKHLFVIKMVSFGDAAGDKDLKVLFTQPKEPGTILTPTTDPVSYTSFERLLDDPKIQSVSISGNGEYSAVSISQRNISNSTFDRSILIFENETGKQVRSISVSNFEWVKDDSYAFTSSGNKTSAIQLASMKNGVVETVIDGIENLSDFSFSNDGSKLLYTLYKEVDQFENGAKRHQGIQDRGPGFRNKYKTLSYDLKTGTTSVITGFDDNLFVSSLSDDNKKLLLTRSGYDLKTRPYSYTDQFIYDFETGTLDSLFRVFYGGGAEFGSGNKQLYLTGGPALFGNTGVTTPPELIPNDYNTLLYRYDLNSKNVVCLTKNFDPAISSFYLDDNSDQIYLLTTDKSYKNIYSLSADGKFKKLELPVKSVERIDFDKKFRYAVFSGSNPDYPDRAWLYNTKTGKSTLLYDPNEKTYKDIIPGKFEEFTFTSSKGRKIEAAVFFPPNFDPTKKYPCIVNYYGGTTPVSNTFEGRYPKNIWTANGYVVFILQPSGAIGYGQEFAAYHVNDWGEVVAQEIIEGTKVMLSRYPSVDASKLGCIGASYGGFMTMSLITKTDMFAAAISHAGISSLSSYWGEGFWGLVYSAVATANSFPWNRKDIYVDKSPLFSADKVNTPLLLLHGNDDTNVPPGESWTFYTALKVLGKDVELIEIDKQDHHILDYAKRKHWSKTILAYFDKYLKKNSAWWNYLYEGSSN
ncbi:S9 family peptidase [Ignavibacteriales bacterium]